MEEHAVPQNITTFEFKLFGPFTIRQFIYVAIGGIIGAVFYFSPLPKAVSYILGAIFVFGGIGFAAIPLQGRSLDKWIIAFFRSITRPTQRIWIKDNHIPYFLETSFLRPETSPQMAQPAAPSHLTRADLQTLLAKQSAKTSNNPFDQKESQFLNQITNLASTVTATSAPPPQNQRGNQTPFSPYTNPSQPTRTTIQAAPKPAQLQAKEEEIKAQELALLQKQKDLEATKAKLEAEKQKRLDLLTDKTTTSSVPTGPEIQKRPEPSNLSSFVTTSPAHDTLPIPENLSPEREIKILPYTPSAKNQPKTDQTQNNSAETAKSMQKLAELDEVLRSQKKIEAEIKAKEEEIKAQQSKIQKEQEKFTSAWEDFKKTKNLADGIDTSTPDMLQGHMLPNIGKKTVISPVPSSNFSAMNSNGQSVAAQIASDINFGGNVIAIPGSHIQFMQGIGDTRIRKLRTRPPDFSKATLPILGERQFDISKELKKRFEQPAPQPQIKTTPAGAIAIEPVKSISDFEPVRAGEIKERESKNFAPPPSPNLNRHDQSRSHAGNQPSSAAQDRHVPQPKHGSVVQPFNYSKESAKDAPKAQVKINLSDHINTPNGVVYDSHGGLIEGALISVYDKSNKPVRAFKTNGLGQFVSVTPLPDGRYTIQTDFDGMTFDTIAFEAAGKLLEPFAITAKN